ncbi:hypothetical protein SAMN05660909_02617 [Chitinophaga terrae (ex Kim and Jung 2007)]|uniref:Uncharacterized protein n=1 Tax=Chitinophaga terrae (ex Kim and Jung 2007) TaxID=408074 RepID=A0A1H4CG92_9BACT|nr:hypothetical protein [Chitinophaga terrae (ex Kim and Jung 2007)]GEP88957.1 hypothetical protein CTE07_06020 [Chitinophaga terrae (ex Kim and Jung 2007)]SEA59339.1 hypothetical protein SAMN05660909_02617 [Chitinophaga terrae (ex Kim and Jung 2007)]
MAQTQKFKVMVVIKDNHGVSRTIYPIIEAGTDLEAKRIAIAQYPNGDVRTVSKIN